jgi:hypothetical protein
MNPMMERMVEQARRLQEELGRVEVEGSAGAGMVRIRLSANHQVRGIEIDQEAVDGDKELLQDLVAAALADALRKVTEAHQTKMAGLATGMGFDPAALRDKIKE